MPIPIQPDDPSYGALPGETRPTEPAAPPSKDHLIVFTSPEMEFANADEFYEIILDLVTRAPGGIMDQQRILIDLSKNLPIYKSYFEANNQDPAAFAGALKDFIDQQAPNQEVFSAGEALNDWRLFALKEKFEQMEEYLPEPPIQPAATWEDFFKGVAKMQDPAIAPSELATKFLQDLQEYEKYYNKNNSDPEGFKAKLQEFAQQAIQEKGYFLPSEHVFSWQASVLNDQAGIIEENAGDAKTDEEKLAVVSAYGRMTKAMLKLFKNMEDAVIAITDLVRVKTELLEIVSEKKSAIGLFTQNDSHPLGADDEEMAAMRDSLNNLGNLTRNDLTSDEGFIRGVIEELNKLIESVMSAKNSWTEDLSASMRSMSQATSKAARANG